MQNLDSLNFDELVPKTSKYLSKEDVGEDGMILTIAGFKLETIKTDDGDEDKIILYFQESDVKPMVVNRTNAQLLKQITGATTAGAARGQQVVVYNDPSIQFAGKITGGIRIKRIPGAPKAAPAKRVPRGPATDQTRAPLVSAAAAAEASNAGLDDQIPF